MPIEKTSLLTVNLAAQSSITFSALPCASKGLGLLFKLSIAFLLIACGPNRTLPVPDHNETAIGATVVDVWSQWQAIFEG